MSTQQEDKIYEYRIKEKNSLFLHLDTTYSSGRTQIFTEIPAQTVTIKGTRIVYTASDKAIANPALFLKLGPSFFNVSQFNNNLENVGPVIPLFSNGDFDSGLVKMETKVTLNKRIPRDISWSIVDSSGKIVDTSIVQLVQLLLEFECDRL